jgi:hypothetical protein
VIKIRIGIHIKLARIPVVNPLEDQNKAKEANDNNASAYKNA